MALIGQHQLQCGFNQLLQYSIKGKSCTILTMTLRTSESAKYFSYREVLPEESLIYLGLLQEEILARGER